MMAMTKEAEDFLILCAHGKRKDLEKALSMGANPNEVFYPADGLRKNALDIAVSMNNTDAAEVLIQHGANPNFQDYNGRTALMYAVLVSSEMVETLLNNGADPNIQDMIGRTPLIMAVSGRDIVVQDFFASLIRTGGLRAEDSDKWTLTAFMYAAICRNLQIESIKILLEHGANASLCDNKGMNARTYAMASDDDEIFMMLMGY
ncbi:MAG: ankyrin repeat domain-containing protein [Synergistaceae bacterium]|nr:ankyrin repeat domain-containing protein [Synergistaceae bacterium]